MLTLMTRDGDDRRRGDRPPLWDARFGEPPWDIDRGEHVWDLHLAFAEAGTADPALYSPSTETVDFIRELAQHREEEMALQLILTCASATPEASLLDHAYRVARLLFERYPDSSAEDADSFVRAWLTWDPDSGEQPSYDT